MSAFSERHYFFSFVYIHEGMTTGLVCRKVLRNSLFEFQGEAQGRTKAQDTPHTFCIAMLDRATLSSNKMSIGHHYSSRPVEESSMTKKIVPLRLLVNTQSETWMTLFTIQKSASMSWSRICLPETWKVLNAKWNLPRVIAVDGITLQNLKSTCEDAIARSNLRRWWYHKTVCCLDSKLYAGPSSSQTAAVKWVAI